MSTVILASHGTDDAVGAAVIRRLVAAVSEALPEHRVLEAFVDVQQPSVAQVLSTATADSGVASGSEAVIVVPLLLSTGYHVRQDITDAVVAQLAATQNAIILVTPALGPSLAEGAPESEIVGLLAQRLLEAGWQPTDSVLLSVAGSSDTAAVAETRGVSEQLQQSLAAIGASGSFDLAFLSAVEPNLKSLVPQLKFKNPRARFAIANYLLAPGFFNNLANSTGAHLVAKPLLDPDLAIPQQLIDVVVRRVRNANIDGSLGCLKPAASFSCAAGCATPCR